MNPIDLRTCKPGQKLRSRPGAILTYVGPNPYEAPGRYPHLVKYPESFGIDAHGTRSNGGRVSTVKPLPGDYDIVEILPLEESSAK